MGKKNKNTNLGQSLIKDRFGTGRRHHMNEGQTYLHTADLQNGNDWNRLNLRSVTEQNSCQEFIETAELAGKEFQAEKLNVRLINPKCDTGVLSAQELEKVVKLQEKYKTLLKIPRRPKWDKSMTAEELRSKEVESFLEWRRELVVLQEIKECILTPYEKNLEFWRQLWRVVDRCDVVVQIVDARNPLLFRCDDLEHYVKEVNPDKMNMILINKADFLTAEQRQIWADYFTKINLQVAFFSATQSAPIVDDGLQEEISTKASEEESTNTSDTDDESENESQYTDSNDAAQEDSSTTKSNVGSTNTLDVDNEVKQESSSADSNDIAQEESCTKESEVETTNTSAINDQVKSSNTNSNDAAGEESYKKESEVEPTNSSGNDDQVKSSSTNPNDAAAEEMENLNLSRVNNSPDILSREELISFFRTIHPRQKYLDGVMSIGLVGYPNVGKSSTINALLMGKKVSVSTTPGKTKHFQTLFLEKDLLLCDCPGLVMPNFVSTKAEMILNGILPINQMRDHVPPMSLLSTFIPKHIIEDLYGIMIPLPNEGEDSNRPPNSEEILNAHGLNRGFMTQNGQPDNARSARYILKDFVTGKILHCTAPPEYDQSKFHTFPSKRRKDISKEHLPPRVIRASKPMKPTTEDLDKTFFQNSGTGIHVRGKINAILQANGDGKPWKKLNKHCNKKKREKTRRLYAHLDN